MIELIVSQGRIADRAPRMIEGAARTAAALQARYDAHPHVVGTPAAHATDDWRVSLPQASATLTSLQNAVRRSISLNPLTFMLSNTCSASLATLPVAAEFFPDLVVLWIDAHGDFNTPATTDSGYLGGMALSGPCGLWDSGFGAGINPARVVLVGARDIDTPERELLHASGVRIISPAQVCPETILDVIKDFPVWIHIDWDVLEPGYLPADYSVPDGLLPAQIRALLEAIPLNQIKGVELAEFNASLDPASNTQSVDVILDIVAPIFDRLVR